MAVVVSPPTLLDDCPLARVIPVVVVVVVVVFIHERRMIRMHDEEVRPSGPAALWQLELTTSTSPALAESCQHSTHHDFRPPPLGPSQSRPEEQKCSACLLLIRRYKHARCSILNGCCRCPIPAFNTGFARLWKVHHPRIEILYPPCLHKSCGFRSPLKVMLSFKTSIRVMAPFAALALRTAHRMCMSSLPPTATNTAGSDR